MCPWTSTPCSRFRSRSSNYRLASMDCRIMRSRIVAIPLSFFMLCPAMVRAQAYRVGVDPRIELMSVLFRLAGNNEYNQCGIPVYDRAIESYFAPYRNHGAVQLARGLTDMGFEGPMSLAVHLIAVES